MILPFSLNPFEQSWSKFNKSKQSLPHPGNKDLVQPQLHVHHKPRTPHHHIAAHHFSTSCSSFVPPQDCGAQSISSSCTPWISIPAHQADAQCTDQKSLITSHIYTMSSCCTWEIIIIIITMRMGKFLEFIETEFVTFKLMYRALNYPKWRSTLTMMGNTSGDRGQKKKG